MAWLLRNVHEERPQGARASECIHAQDIHMLYMLSVQSEVLLPLITHQATDAQ